MATTSIIAVLIGIVFPIYVVLTHKRINLNIKRDGAFRLIDYKLTLFIFWFLTLLVILQYLIYKQPKLNFYPNFSIIGLIVFLLIMAFSIFQYKSTKISAEHSNDIKNKLNAIYHYLPKTKQERFWFILLSISAGICEEIIFRLFLFEFCREHTMLGFAFIIPNIIFALTHIGSGISNLIIAFILGLLFSVIYYFTQNIWLAVLLHIAIDINTGLLAYNVEQIQKQSNIPL